MASSTFFSMPQVRACIYIESPWEYQMMLFRPQLKSMQSLQMFNYTSKLFYSTTPDPQQNDRVRNCKEWQQQMGKDVYLEDVFIAQYGKYYEEVFNREKPRNNTFLIVLQQPKNKMYLDYFHFAKRMELTERTLIENRFEPWNTDPEKDAQMLEEKMALYKEASVKINIQKLPPFLKERYAYQICRLAYQMKNYELASSTYDKYFKTFDAKSLMNIWSALFKAQSLAALENKAEADVWYARVFDNSDEKKLRCIQMYNNSDPSTVSDKNLQSVMLAMKIINYPGRALVQMDYIYRLNPQSKYLPFLIQREINKIEDWLLTSRYYHSLYTAKYETFDMFVSGAAVNREDDINYMRTLRRFIENINRNETNAANKDFYNLAIAHLYLLNSESKKAQLYLSRINTQADSSILVQRDLEEIFMMIKTKNPTQKEVQKNLADRLLFLQKNIKNDYDKNKILYSLLLTMSNAFVDFGDYTTANLLTMKSETFKNKNQNYYEGYELSYYNRLRLFEQRGNIAEIDAVINLLLKKDKTPFENFITTQNLGTVEAFLELEGTLAFRNNDWATAYKYFKKLPNDYWQNNYEFKNYLTENPFQPKGLSTTRDFTYNFNKTEFVKSLIDLEAGTIGKSKTRAADLIQLGNAMYNCSYYGNAWMMCSYGWSVGDRPDSTDTWQKINYYNCDLAKSFYTKALEAKPDKEQKAFINLMLFRCYLSQYNINPDALQIKDQAVAFANEFSKSSKTNTFKQYDCPGIREFITKK